MNLFILIIIGISLSMDAFSMSMAYGTLNISKKEILILSFIVGIYHFIMPQLGNLIGNSLFFITGLNTNLFISFILILIGLEMIFDTLRNKDQIKKMSLLKMLLFGFTVSIDSFSVGIGIKNITSNILISSIIFTFFSFSFTLIGSLIGSKINQILGSISTIFGGIILIVIALTYIF